MGGVGKVKEGEGRQREKEKNNNNNNTNETKKGGMECWERNGRKTMKIRL